MGLLFAFDFMFGELYLLGFGLGHLFCFSHFCVHSFICCFRAVSATRSGHAAHQTHLLSPVEKHLSYHHWIACREMMYQQCF
jgi:hypothetical protein